MSGSSIFETMKNDASNAHVLEDKVVKELATMSRTDISQTHFSEEKDETVSISDLMEKYGITAEDFQTVCYENPQMISAIGGGKTCEELAKAANRVRTQYVNGKPMTGKCLPGVRNIYNRCKNDSLSCQAAMEAMAESRFPYQKTNGGGNGFIALEASGNYITIAIENKAYGTQKQSEENIAMNEFIKNVQSGITLTVDSIEDPTMRQKCGNNNGNKYGHIAVKRDDNRWACDFVQETINFARYGKYARICVPTDAYVSPEYAQKLIEHAQARQQKNSQNLQLNALQNRNYE